MRKTLGHLILSSPIVILMSWMSSQIGILNALYILGAALSVIIGIIFFFVILGYGFHLIDDND